MQQQSESRRFGLGIDTDTSPHLIEDGAVLNAVNLRSLRQTGQKAGRYDWIPGNLPITVFNDILPSGANELLGKCADDATACLYFFILATDPDESIIAEYDTTTQSARVVIEGAGVTGGFGWTTGMFVDCDVVERILYFVDGTNEWRYVNLDETYTVGSPISQGQLSTIAEPGFVPAEAIRVDQPTANSTIQFTPVQFTYRILNTVGFMSVLAPYSLTSFPARTSDIISSGSATYDNTITVTIRTDQPIPSNWKRIELVARFVESNTFYVIKTWNLGITADEAEVALHMATTTPLTLTEWDGDTLETIDELTAAKQADSIPRAPHAQEFFANRAGLANYTEGYDTPVEAPAIVFTQNTAFASILTSTPRQAYIVILGEKDTRNWYFAVILRFDGVNYLMPKATSIGVFHHNTDDITGTITVNIADGLFSIPLVVSSEHLIEMVEQGDPVLGTLGGYASTGAAGTPELVRKRIVEEANSLDAITPQDTDTNFYLFEYEGFVEVEDTPSEFGLGGERRAFLGVDYNPGIRYFDAAGRSAGVKLMPPISIPPYDLAVGDFITSITATLPGVTTAIPDWAETFILTLSSPANVQRFGMFFGGIVKAAFKNGDGEVSYRDSADLLTPPTGFTIYGIAVPIPSTFPYEYTAGDYVRYSSVTISGTAKVIGTHAGHLILQFTDDGGMHLICDGFSKRMTIDAALNVAELTDSTVFQEKVGFVLYAGTSTSDSQFEIAVAGGIDTSVSPRQFTYFFSSGMPAVDIDGDTHTQIRTSDSGGGLGVAMSTYENTSSMFWVNDHGRPAPTDTVGQKTLTNYIRFSNTRIPGATINGYASFDADDYRTTDITAGAIIALALTTRGTQDGGQLLAICEHGAFSALVGQQQIKSADGANAFTATVQVIGDFNIIRGGWGTQSPRSVVTYEGKVWWVDAFRRAVIEFNESGGNNISLFRASRMWDDLLGGVSNPMLISAGIDPYTRNLYISLPVVDVSPANLPGFESVRDDSDAVYGAVQTQVYDWDANKWVGGYTSGAEIIHCGTQVFGWNNELLWGEFTGIPGNYYGNDEQAILAVPFNAGTPVIKAALNLRLFCGSKPVITRFSSINGSAVAGPYRRQEGVNEASVMKNRVGRNATDNAGYLANSVSGQRLKGAVITAIIYWENGETIDLSDAALVSEVSSGH